MAIVDLELQDGFSQSNSTDSCDPKWDSKGPSQIRGDLDGSDASTSEGEFPSTQEVMDFSDLELAQRIRHGMWRLVHRRHGGLVEAGA
jgi:hypothetical protein